MENFEQPGTSAFNRLPVELLVMILNHSLECSESGYWRYVLDFPLLKALRLTCRQYAYLPEILKILFPAVCFVGSPEHARLAECTDLSRVRPYIRKLVMVPSRYSWNMTLDVFEQIILATPVSEFCLARIKNLESMQERRNIGEELLKIKEVWLRGNVKDVVEDHMSGQRPFSDHEIRTGYEHYMQQARKTQEFYKSGEIQQAWAKVLKQLSGVSVLRVGSWDYEDTTMLKHARETKGKTWKEIGCTITGHKHDYFKHKSSECDLLQEAVGEALLSTAIASLIDAGFTITQLEVECHTDGTFGWVDNGELEALDLRNLETLNFNPKCSEDSHGTIMEERYGIAILEILQKCTTSLQTLKVFPYYWNMGGPWPPTSLGIDECSIALPALRQFETGIDLRLISFASFLSQAPKLEVLELNGCGERDGEWRDLFDAIRHHPNRMQLNFDQLLCFDWTELSLYHHTGGPSEEIFDNDPNNNILYSIENYLSNLRHWDRSCKMWFENGEGLRTDSDSNSEEDEDENGESDGSTENEDEEAANDVGDYELMAEDTI